MSMRALFPLLVALAVLGLRSGSPAAFAEEAATGNYNAAELKELVGPVALYPDMVIASLLPATTFPAQVTEAAAYLAKQSGAVTKPPADTKWDSSVQAMLQYPDLLKWLNANPDWVAQMHFAVANQQSEVLAAVQAFRAEAQKAGNLTTDSHQVVSTKDVPGGSTEVIIIEPADPTIVYVPTYSPTAVTQPGYAWPWGVGLAVGATAAWVNNNNIGWGANGGSINVNNSTNINVSGNNVGNSVGVNRPTQFNATTRPATRPAGVGGVGGVTGAGGVGQPGGVGGAGGVGQPGGAGGAGGVGQPGGVGGAGGAGQPGGAGGVGQPGGAGGAGKPGGVGGAGGAGQPGGVGGAGGAGKPGGAGGAGGVGQPGGAGGAGATRPPAARPTTGPSGPSSGFGGAGDGASARAASDRGGSSLKSSGGGAGGGGSYKGQSGRSSGGGSAGGGGGGGGGGGRSGGGGGGRRR